MDREQLIAHLAQAERHVKLGEDHIARQKELVARLEAHGLDTTEAKRLLCEFQELLTVHIAGRDRMRHELALASRK